MGDLDLVAGCVFLLYKKKVSRSTYYLDSQNEIDDLRATRRVDYSHASLRPLHSVHAHFSSQKLPRRSQTRTTTRSFAIPCG